MAKGFTPCKGCPTPQKCMAAGKCLKQAKPKTKPVRG